jgi:hypothetical protein
MHKSKPPPSACVSALLPCALQHVPEPTAAAVTAQQALQQQQLQLQQQQQQSTDGSITTTTVARPAFASSSLTAPAGGGYWATAASGWVVALSLLAAVRQGRAHADAARLDVRALQARQQDSRIQVRHGMQLHPRGRNTATSGSLSLMLPAMCTVS